MSVIDEFFRADRGARASLFTEDGVVEFPFAPEDTPNRFTGRAAINDLFTTLGARADDADMHVDEQASTFTLHETGDPEILIAELELHVKDLRLPYIQVFRIKDGKIALFRDYWGPITAAFTKAALTQ